MPAQNQNKTMQKNKKDKTLLLESHRSTYKSKMTLSAVSQVFFLLHLTVFVSSIIIKNVCMCDQKLLNGEMLKDSKRRVIGSFVKISHLATC